VIRTHNKPMADEQNDQRKDQRKSGDENDLSQETPQAPSGASPEEVAAQEINKWRNEYMYLRAEFDNYKKNVIKERSDLRKYGSERLVVDLLATLDLLEAALSTDITPENMATLRKGVELTAHELRSTLQRHGVEEVAAAGAPFDPAVHEALSSEETNEHPEGHVSRVFKKPYKLHDRVVRHGQVVVAKPRS
jgi:molecular chaperone GrpE